MITAGQSARFAERNLLVLGLLGIVSHGRRLERALVERTTRGEDASPGAFELLVLGALVTSYSVEAELESALAREPAASALEPSASSRPPSSELLR